MSAKAVTGTVKTVTSLANPLVKSLRALHLKKHRDETGLFLAEGLQLVRYAIEANWKIETLVCATDSLDEDAIADAAAQTKAAGGMVLQVPIAVLAKIARRDNPQTVLGAFRQHFGKLAETVRPDAGSGLWVALDRIRDPGNLGTIIRTVDAANAEGVILIGESCDPFSSETVRATMGSIFHVPLTRTGESEFLDHAKTTTMRLVGTHLTGAVDFRNADYQSPCVLVMGNEQKGLSDALANSCDQLVRIPMAGRAESLNLAVATGLMIYEARRDALI
jgi:TrmH family RNA methyltransferase